MSPSTISRMSCTSCAEHETALDPHAEREPGVHLGIDARGLQHVRVHHAAAAPLDPARAALEGGVPEVELGARLGEREEARAQAHLRLVAEDRLHEVVEGALEVRHGEALVDGHALELHEDRQVRGVELVGAEHATRSEHVERQLALEHRADLHRARVRAQHEVRLGRVDEERVLHGARRVIGVEVQRIEVEPLALDLGALGDLPAHSREDVAHPVLQQRERMPRAGREPRRQRRDVDGLGGELRGGLGLDDLGLAGGERLVDAAAGAADELAESGLLLVGHVAQLGVQERQRRLLAGVLGADLLQRGRVAGRRDGREGCVDRRLHGALGDFTGLGHEERV